MTRLIDRYYDLLSRAVAGSRLAASFPLFYGLYAIPSYYLGLPRLGLFQHDPLLGWRLRPDVSVVHPGFEFRARYSTDTEGRRKTPDAGRGPSVFVLGCSWSFGSSVSDEHAYPALLARDFSVTNWSVPGYGTTQQYLLLTRVGVLERALREGASLVYAWIPSHLPRVWRRRSWYENLEHVVGESYQGNPLCEIEDDQLVFRGLTRAVDAVSDDNPLVALMEWRITAAAISAMRDEAGRAGVPFTVAMLPTFGQDPGIHVGYDKMASLMARLGVDTVDLRRPGDDHDLRMTFQHDSHPTPAGQLRIAERLAAALRERSRAHHSG